MDEIKVLIVDDHQIIIDGIKSLLKDQYGIRVVGEAGNGKEAIDALSLIGADVVLMDIDMPVLNGIEATRKIKSGPASARVIILTMHNEAGLVKTLISAGADGYMLKNSDQHELVDAIRKVASGQSYFSPEVTLSLLHKSAHKPEFSEPANLAADLTSREIEVLKLIALGHSNREIGESLFISHRTVDTHRTNLMKKIGVNNIAGLIRYAIKQGFIS